MDKYFLTLQFKRGFRFFKVNPTAKIITVTLFALVLGGLAFGIFRFFIKGFTFITEIPFFASAVSLYMYGLFLILVMVMVWIGSCIALVFSLFRDKSNAWILAAPRFLYVPYTSFLKTSFGSIWILLIVLLPASIAAVIASKQSIWLSIIPLISSLLFATALTSGVFIFTLVVGKILTLFSRRLLSFGTIALIHGGVILYMLGKVARRFAASDLIKVLYAEDLYTNKAPLTLVTDLFHVFPTHKLALNYLAAQTGDIHQLFVGFGWILGVTVLSLIVLVIALKLWFLPIWQALSENRTELFTPGKKKLHRSSLLNSRYGAVFYKEMVSLTRNGRNLFWFLFIIMLWLAHVGFQSYIQKIIVRHELQSTQIPLLATVLPVAILAYFTASLVLRFAFPSFSEEKESAWIFMVSPLSKKGIIWTKFIFYAVIFSLATLVAELTGLSVATTPQVHAVAILLLSLVMTFFLTAVGVSLGAAFPNFETSDPERLSTSLPGLATVAISISYGALATFILYNYIHTQNPLQLYFLTAFSLIVGVVAILLAIKKSKKVEFVSKRVA